MQFFLRFLYGVRVRVSGDEILFDQPAVVIMNHRTRLDWLYYWMVLWRMNPWLATTNKIALKQLLKYVPCVGRCGVGAGCSRTVCRLRHADAAVHLPEARPADRPASSLAGRGVLQRHAAALSGMNYGYSGLL